MGQATEQPRGWGGRQMGQVHQMVGLRWMASDPKDREPKAQKGRKEPGPGAISLWQGKSHEVYRRSSPGLRGVEIGGRSGLDRWRDPYSCGTAPDSRDSVHRTFPLSSVD
jgi:hypothetical protein